MSQITLKGTPVTLAGREPKVGDKAPDFALRRSLGPGGEYTLTTDAGKVRLLNVVVSLDTPMCDLQTRTFNQRAMGLSDKVVVVTVSADLPPAQARWCGAAHADRVVTGSDYYDRSFGHAYGLLVKEMGVLARAIFVVDPQGRIAYKEVVQEITAAPDYEKALAAAKAALG